MSDDISSARTQVNEARAVVEQKKQESAQIEEQLNRQQQALPNTTSQTALRQTFAGMQGRLQRQQINQARSQIGQKLNEVQAYRNDLSNYEQQVKQAEAGIQDYDSYQQAKWAYNRSIAPNNFSGNTRNYLEQMYNDSNASQELGAQIQSALSKYNSGTPLNEAFKGMNVNLLVREGYLKFQGQDNLGQGMSVDPSMVKQASSNFNTSVSTNYVNPISQMAIRAQDRNARSQFQASARVSTEPFQLVSAQQQQALELNPNTGRPYGLVESVPAPKNILEWGQQKVSQLRAKEYSQGGSLSAGLGTTVLNTAGMVSALPKVILHPVKTVQSAWGGLSQTNWANKGESFGRTLRDEPGFVTGMVLGNIALTKGTGAIAKAGTVAVYKSAGLPKVTTTFLSREVGQVGEDTFLKTASMSNVKGALVNRKVLTGAMTQVRNVGEMGDITAFKAGTVGALREKNIIGSRWSGPKKFGSADVGLYKEATFTKPIGDINGVPVYRSADVNRFSMFGKTKIGNAKPAYSATVGVSRNINNAEAVWGLSKPVNVRGSKVRFGSGTQRVFGIVEQPKESSIWGFGGTGMNSMKRVTKGPGTIALASQKTTINNAIKSNFLNNVGNTAKNIGSSTGGFASAIGLSKATTKPTATIKSEPAQTTKPKDSMSMFFGTGQYEKTEQVSYSKPKESSKSIWGLDTSTQQRSVSNQAERLKNVNSSASRANQSNKSMSGLASALGLKTNQSQRYAQRTSQTFRTPMRFRAGFRVGSPAFVPKKVYSTNGGSIIKTGVNSYQVLVRRYGQLQVVGEASSLEEAKRILKYNLETSLSASGFVTEKSTGRKQDVSSLWGNMFRPGKKDPFLLVQKRGKRLSSSSEVFGIQSARRNAPKKSKKINFFGSSQKKTKRLKWF